MAAVLAGLAAMRAVSAAEVWDDGEGDTDCDGELLPEVEPGVVGDAEVWLGLLDGEALGEVDEADGVGVGVLDGVGVGVGVLDGDGVGVFVGVAVGVGVLVAGST